MLGAFGSNAEDRVAIDSMVNLLEILGNKEATGETLTNLANAIDQNMKLLAEVKAAQSDVLARELAVKAAEEAADAETHRLAGEWEDLTGRRQQLSADQAEHAGNVAAHKDSWDLILADLDAKRLALSVDVSSFDQYKSETERGLTQREVAISAREDAMTERENALAQKANDLEARQKALRDLVA